jgi:hypothetical protein
VAFTQPGTSSPRSDGPRSRVASGRYARLRQQHLVKKASNIRCSLDSFQFFSIILHFASVCPVMAGVAGKKQQATRQLIRSTPLSTLVLNNRKGCFQCEARRQGATQLARPLSRREEDGLCRLGSNQWAPSRLRQLQLEPTRSTRALVSCARLRVQPGWQFRASDGCDAAFEAKTHKATISISPCRAAKRKQILRWQMAKRLFCAVG